MKRDPFLLDGLVVLIFLLVGLVLGTHQLLDLDLGWHLAGGMWMLDHQSIPQLDPLSAVSSEWVAYSWLPELLAAQFYREYDFGGLEFLQLLLVLTSLACVLALNRAVVNQHLPKNQIRYRLAWALASFAIVFFIAPIWHLRPQLLSLIFFTFALSLGEAGKLNARNVLLLGVLWVNVHVFWLILPLVVALYRIGVPILRGERYKLTGGVALTIATFALGLINPYGAAHYEVLWQYAFEHSVASSLITEFQPLQPAHGLIFWLYWLVLLVVLPFLFQRFSPLTAQRRILFLVTAFLAAYQIKYIAIFGVVAGTLLAEIVIPAMLEAVRFPRSAIYDDAHLVLRVEQKILAATLVLFFSVICGSYFQVRDPLPEKVRELLLITREISDGRLSAGEKQQPVNVLNFFDDGGWLEFGFYLSRAPDEVQAKFRPAIDGRTLVMGPERLSQFETLRKGGAEWCSVLEQWRVTKAVLPQSAKLVDALQSGTYPGTATTEKPCNPKWHLDKQTPHWAVLSVDIPRPPQRKRGKRPSSAARGSLDDATLELD